MELLVGHHTGAHEITSDVTLVKVDDLEDEVVALLYPLRALQNVHRIEVGVAVRSLFI